MAVDFAAIQDRGSQRERAMDERLGLRIMMQSWKLDSPRTWQGRRLPDHLIAFCPLDGLGVFISI